MSTERLPFEPVWVPVPTPRCLIYDDVIRILDRDGGVLVEGVLDDIEDEEAGAYTLYVHEHAGDEAHCTPVTVWGHLNRQKKNPIWLLAQYPWEVEPALRNSAREHYVEHGDGSWSYPDEAMA